MKKNKKINKFSNLQIYPAFLSQSFHKFFMINFYYYFIFKKFKNDQKNKIIEKVKKERKREMECQSYIFFNCL